MQSGLKIQHLVLVFVLLVGSLLSTAKAEESAPAAEKSSLTPQQMRFSFGKASFEFLRKLGLVAVEDKEEQVSLFDLDSVECSFPPALANIKSFEETPVICKVTDEDNKTQILNNQNAIKLMSWFGAIKEANRRFPAVNLPILDRVAVACDEKTERCTLRGNLKLFVGQKIGEGLEAYTIDFQ